MKVNVRFLEVEGAREVFGDNKIVFNLQGASIGDLLREIMQTYGEKTDRVFLTNGRYENNLQIIVNWRKYVSPNQMDDFMIREGDTVIFAPLLDGG